MSKLVYIQEIDADTFLLFTKKEESFCLRDYFRPTNERPREVMRQSEGKTASSIEEMAKKPGNHYIDEPGLDESFDNFKYWKKKITEVNQQYSLPRKVQSQQSPKERHWGIEIIIGVVIAVLAAIIVTWLGIKQ